MVLGDLAEQGWSREATFAIGWAACQAQEA
jgi:hypothetical protein